MRGVPKFNTLKLICDAILNCFRKVVAVKCDTKIFVIF